MIVSHIQFQQESFGTFKNPIVTISNKIFKKMKLMKHLLISVIMFFSFLGFAQENISLITPNDTDSINTKYPMLSWMYMGGIQQNNERSYYRLVVVELKENQSAEAGITVNQPILVINHIQGMQLYYPFDAPELKEGIWYGWQVQKIQNNIISYKSESWKFIIPLEMNKNQFYKMKIKNDGADYIVKDGKVRFEFIEQYHDDNMKFYLYNSENELMDVKIDIGIEQDDTEASILIKQTGSNYYEIDLGKYPLPGSYKLVVLDRKQQRYEMKFIVQ